MNFGDFQEDIALEHSYHDIPLQNEERSFAISEFILHCMEDYFLNVEETPLTNKIRNKANQDLAIMQTFHGHQSSLFFRMIFRVFFLLSSNSISNI